MQEKQLINEIIAGKCEKFSQLIKSHQQALSCYLLTNTKNKEDAEDILQETFLNAYKYLSSYNPKWKFKSWLFTIARRLLYKYYQQKEMPDFIQPQYVEIEDCFIQTNNIWSTVKRIVNQQSFDVLWLFYSEEFSIKEIACILNCSQSRVKMCLYRSRKKLAKNTEVQSYFNELVTVV